jgi:hypothetical protein
VLPMSLDKTVTHVSGLYPTTLAQRGHGDAPGRHAWRISVALMAYVEWFRPDT